MASRRPLRGRSGLPTKHKAGEMLEHGEVRGKPLTKPQKGLFGLIRSGKRPSRLGGSRRKRM